MDEAFLEISAILYYQELPDRNFLGGWMVKNPPCKKKKKTKNPPSNAGDMGLIPGQGTEIPYATESQPTSHNQRVHTPQQKVLSDATTIPMPQLRPTAAK